MSVLDEYLTREQLAEELEVSPRTLIRYELEPDGLPSVRIGAKVRYRLSDVQAWIDRRTRRPNPRRKGRS
jgi:excisionase family DNA binding protein